MFFFTRCGFREQRKFVLFDWYIDRTGFCHNPFRKKCVRLNFPIFFISWMAFTISCFIASVVFRWMRSFPSLFQRKGFLNFSKSFMRLLEYSLKYFWNCRVSSWWWNSSNSSHSSIFSKNRGIFILSDKSSHFRSTNSPSTQFIYVLCMIYNASVTLYNLFNCLLHCLTDWVNFSCDDRTASMKDFADVWISNINDNHFMSVDR